MPDPAPTKRRPVVGLPGHSAVGPLYAELHCKTNFSFLEGASHPDELVCRAAELGYAALAVTDRNSLAGVVRAHAAAKEIGLQLLIGAEIVPLDAPAAVLLATDRAAYGRLSRLITVGRRRAPKGECHLTFDDLAEHAEGLLALVIEGKERGAENGERGTGNGGHLTPSKCASEGETNVQRPTAKFMRNGELAAIKNQKSKIKNYHGVFGDRCYLLAELCRGPDDERRLDVLGRLAREARVPLAAAGDVHYHEPDRAALHDVLTAVRLGTTVASIGEHRFPNAQRHLKPPQEIAAQFARRPDALRRTLEIAARCRFSLDELRYEYPEELCPAGVSPSEHLARLTWQGARKRYPGGVPDKVRQLIEHELALIRDLRYEPYFLTVWDLVRFARSRSILCQGRGSAANSAVCYALEVTSVDPGRLDVLFERFISRERDEAPDIDVDFEHERREEVLQYIYEKYGRERAAMTAEVITYQPRSAVRDVAKALGLSLDRVDRLAKTLDSRRATPRFADRFREAGLDPDAPLGLQLAGLVEQLIGFPRHLSQHVGGMVITRWPVCELVPVENAAMPERTVIQWDKDDLDQLGILKVDCLALGMLTAIRKCFDLVERHEGLRLGLASVPPDDKAVYDMICRADTVGVFQIESRAQMSMLPRLRPRCFYDLVIEVAIVRPGPIQGDMVHPYLRRRVGQEAVTYPNEAIRQVLDKTLGVPLFQEQAMRLAVVAAGFTPGEADQLRRAMGAWRKTGVIEQFRQKLIQGMRANGLSPEYAQRVFDQIRGFGEYGFPESHAASFALLVYVSAWLKCHYPAAFAAALLNSQPMGFYAPAQLVRDAKNHGVEVLPWDVNHSEWDCTLEGGEEMKNGERGTGNGEWGAGGSFNPKPQAPACAREEDERPTPNVQRPTSNEDSSSASFPVPRSPFPVLLHSTSSNDEDHGERTTRNQKGLSLRLGLRLISGLSANQAEVICQARRLAPFRSVDDLARRTGLGKGALARLARADALGSLGLNRRQALWQALPQEKELPLFAGLDMDEQPPPLPMLPPAEEVLTDYRTVGLSLRDHPMTFLRPRLDEMKVLRASQLATWPAGSYVRVAGVVLVRQRPGTASGVTFVTLEDETGTANLIVRPDVWERFHRAAGSPVLLACGRLQREGLVIHVLTSRMEKLSVLGDELRNISRNFR